MKRKLYAVFLFFTIMMTGFTIKMNGQCTVNYLINGGFESPVQSTLGNNFPPSVPAWTLLTGGTFSNLVKVDGTTDYFGGPNAAADAGAGGTQYFDLLGTGFIGQTFTLGCTADLTFSGAFSSREGGYNFTAIIEILDGTSTVVASSTTRVFSPADADFTVPPGPDAVWYTLTGTATSLPAGTYTFRVSMDDGANFDNAFLCASPGCVLPVTLKSVEAKMDDCAATLKWAVESETNFKNYIVEYSQNGTDFTAAGTVVGVANNTAKTYSFKHLPASGKAFYRLKMVDIDGSSKYSKTVLVTSNCDKDAVLIYPNPVTDVLTVNLKKASSRQVAFASVYDQAGRMMYRKQLVNGANTIDMSKMPSGMYNVVIINEDEVTSYKIQRK